MKGVYASLPNKKVTIANNLESDKNIYNTDNPDFVLCSHT